MPQAVRLGRKETCVRVFGRESEEIKEGDNVAPEHHSGSVRSSAMEGWPGGRGGRT